MNQGNVSRRWTINLFDSRNTSFENYDENPSYSQIKEKCIQLSKLYHKIILENNNGFEEFENGEMVSWSYPNGCGQIKFNS